MEKDNNNLIHQHFITRVGWLRASVLGANDGILSVSSILGGMSAGDASRESIVLAGIAALAAGATAMATGEYVSVSSQADLEKNDLEREKIQLINNPDSELEELTQIYVDRGLELSLARQVAESLTKHDALGAHARDELGINEITSANPMQAALASAASFTVGGIIPLLIVFSTPKEFLFYSVIFSSMFSLAILGALGAKTGGVKILKPTIRILLWGAISLGITTLVGIIFKVSV